LRSLRDPRRKLGRVGQQIVYGPGSTMRARRIAVTSPGPALGEVVSEGDLLDSYQNVLATYRQRFRVWWARPLLELQIEIQPREPPVGYPWHAYYGSRFAWRDPRATLFRSVNLQCSATHHTRPESPDLIEVHSGNERTALFLGGLPFVQRQGQRMLDVVLIPEGETSRVFELALAIDLDEPVQGSFDFLTPPMVVPVHRGPPHVGSSGWLFHSDASNLILTSLRPAADAQDAVIARLVETRGVSTATEVRCARSPVRARVIDERDQVLEELQVSGDSITVQFAAGDMKRVRIEFS
jgi:hypothetical protein